MDGASQDPQASHPSAQSPSEAPMSWQSSARTAAPRPRGRWPLGAGLLAGAAAVAGAALAFSSPRSVAPPPTAHASPPSAPQQATAAPAAPAPAPAPAELRTVRIATKPTGARVLLNGAELGTTPYSLQFRASTTVELSKTGYDKKAITVDSSSDPNLVVELVASKNAPPRVMPAQQAAPAPAPAPPPAAVPLAAPPPPPARAALPAQPPPSNTANDTEISLRNAYRSGQIDRWQYRQRMDMLDARYRSAVALEKRYLREGRINRWDYERRVQILKAQRRGSY